MPDVSDDQLGRYRALLLAMYPVRDVQLTVREPVSTSIEVKDGGWSDLLDELRALRARDAPPSDVYYFGLVSPAATFSTYCRGACTAGIAYRAVASVPGLRVGVGLGYPGATAVETMAHELGHSHGLAHSPCGASADVDRSYPYEGGSIGSWGWDMRTNGLLDPATYRDIMGYCRRNWISDYSYQALLGRSVAVNSGARQAALTLQERQDDASRRVLLVDGAGRARWGLSAEGLDARAGVPERAEILDEAGRSIATVEVYRTPIEHTGEALVLVPAPRAGWHAIRVAGATTALPFAAPSAVPPLRD
jgi:hypothetical protein